MGYAIIQAAGSQLRVSQGEVVRIPSVSQEVGSSITFAVLARGDGDRVEIGSPLVDGAVVSGTVVEHGRAKKVIVFKYKRRKQYKKTHGHRQNFTAVRIDSIGLQADAAEPAASSGESDSVDAESTETAEGTSAEETQPEGE